jgi:hypothetical protein
MTGIDLDLLVGIATTGLIVIKVGDRVLVLMLDLIIIGTIRIVDDAIGVVIIIEKISNAVAEIEVLTAMTGTAATIYENPEHLTRMIVISVKIDPENVEVGGGETTTGQRAARTGRIKISIMIELAENLMLWIKLSLKIQSPFRMTAPTIKTIMYHFLCTAHAG